MNYTKLLQSINLGIIKYAPISEKDEAFCTNSVTKKIK